MMDITNTLNYCGWQRFHIFFCAIKVLNRGDSANQRSRVSVTSRWPPSPHGRHSSRVLDNGAVQLRWCSISSISRAFCSYRSRW
jgi:hypothetical protein